MPDMYLEHFGLLEAPFSIAPDPGYLYMSERHREALAHLLYGLETDGAFILLTGDVGTGKTTVSRCLLEQVPEHTELALVLNPKLSALELLQVICDELAIDYSASPGSAKYLVDQINQHLLSVHAEGRKTVVMVEEAQNLAVDVLEQLRLLTNLETSERKLLQVILLGQPELLDILDRPELTQLAQRITARFHLSPLDKSEVAEYIGHRLAVAGCRRPLFADGAVRQIYRYSGGVPRLINVICDRALLGCYVQERQQVNLATVHRAAREVLGEARADKTRSRPAQRFFSVRRLAGVALVLLACGLIIWQWPQLNAYLADRQVKKELREETRTVTGFNWPVTTASDESALVQAYRQLFQVWQLKFEPQTQVATQVETQAVTQAATLATPCFYARSHGLSCLHESTDIEGLRLLNRPAILVLHDDLNQRHYATLMALDEQAAHVILDGQKQLMPLEMLSYYWQGEFSMLWRNPPGYDDLIRPGSQGGLVVWLGQMMNRIDNTPQLTVSAYYNAELEQRVRAFQQRRGLMADGVVGVKTLIHINEVIGQPAPRLGNHLRNHLEAGDHGNNS